MPTFSLLAISDRTSLGEAPFQEWLRRLAAASVGAVQIREKDLSDRDLYALTREARSALPPSTAVLVNGRIDVALAAAADGCHLPADGVPLAALRQRFGHALLGRSAHYVEDVEQAARDGADYVTFGPVYATPSKARYGAPKGLEELRRAAGIGIPVYALGGVMLSRFAEVAEAGAAGVAGIRLFQGPELFAAAEAARRLFP